MAKTASERAADTLTYLQETAQRLRSQRDYNNADRAEISAGHVMQVLKQRGITCACGYYGTSKASRLRCKCSLTSAGKRKRGR